MFKLVDAQTPIDKTCLICEGTGKIVSVVKFYIDEMGNCIADLVECFACFGRGTRQK